MSFPSLYNNGDYFSPHYLDALLQNDLRQLREVWEEREGRGEPTARAGLKALGRAFFAAKTDAVEDKTGNANRTAHDLVLGALGFTPNRTELAFTCGGEDDLIVAVAHAAETATGLHLIAIDLGWADSLDDALDASGAGRLLTPLTGRAAPRKPKDPAAGTEAISLIFATDEPPRYVLALAGGIVILADRAAWAEGRFLAADLDLALDRRDIKPRGEIETLAALFSADALLPDDGATTLDTLTANSLKHAVGVSKDLRDGVRQSIELLANEVITRRLAANRRVYDEPDLARQLTRQCLRYIYRIIVLLYAESRRELGVLPVDHPEYGEGYGLDRLRALVLTPLVNDGVRQGTHLYESLAVLFRLVNDGYRGDKRELALGDAVDTVDITFTAMSSQLFAARSTQLIDEVKLGNGTLQQVLSLLMLSKERRGKDRGFVSYAQLGIDQLGAVYEGLMAYSGFFAAEDLYEVSQPGKADRGTWVVPVAKADIYPNDVFVTVPDPITGQDARVRHPKGSFVFRLSGRDRQRSASFYTPEVLTRCVVKHSLAELLTDDTPAERILTLTVCEPALGSGAFVNEAVNQLADEYLRRRQAELNATISPDDYQTQRQKVRAHLALHNCYGVDLNATAVELAEVSLWLNSLSPGLPAPWFGMHLRRGNSLIGARRATYAPSLLAKSMWTSTPPVEVPLTDPIADGHIHHFLLPAHGWAAVADAKEAKELRPERATALRTWRKQMLKPPSERDTRRLQALAARVEVLWQQATTFVAIADRSLRRPIDVWGTTPEAASTAGSRERVQQALRDPDSALGRLRLVMNAWCALWFWPIEGAEPPSLAEWLATLEGLLLSARADAFDAAGQQELFAQAGTLDDYLADELDRTGRDMRPTADVLADQPWLTTVTAIGEREGFFHWQLEFAHVFANGGFDLVVGNPPWTKLGRFDTDFLMDLNPEWALAGAPPQGMNPAELRAVLGDGISSFLLETAASEGTRESLSSPTRYPLTASLLTNLYSCFMEQTWRLSGPRGIVGLIHPEAHFTDPGAGRFRAATYRRLRRHWQFINESQLFEDIDHRNIFGVQVYGADQKPSFLQASHLQDPSTVDASLEHDGSGEVPGIQYPAGGWDLRPHQDRVLVVDSAVLASWVELFDEPGTPADQARLLRPVTRADFRALVTLARQPVRLVGLYRWSPGFHEKSAKDDGIIVKRTEIRESWDEVILQGPHFTVATPLAKVPNEGYRHKTDNVTLDIEAIPERFVPRTNYQCGVAPAAFGEAIQQWDGRPNTQRWRTAWRNMTASGNERGLHSAVIPLGATHVHTVHTMAMRTDAETVFVAGLWSTIPFDYLVKVSGTGHVGDDLIRRFPAPIDTPYAGAILLRTLRLNCLTADYAPLWEELFDPAFTSDAWAEPAITGMRIGDIGPTWMMDTPLRTDYDRRKALVELDALVALALGLSAEQLCAMYRSQFAVLRKYEFNMAFSANGRKIAKDHQTAGFHQEKGDWDLAKSWFENPNTTTLPARYTTPLWRPNREAEMTSSWHAFKTSTAL